jgi:hypothetical protein
VHETVHEMCNNHPNLETGMKVLNVGFGLGIVSFPCAAILCTIRLIGDTYADRFILPGAASSAFDACYH